MVSEYGEMIWDLLVSKVKNTVSFCHHILHSCKSGKILILTCRYYLVLCVKRSVSVFLENSM